MLLGCCEMVARVSSGCVLESPSFSLQSRVYFTCVHRAITVSRHAIELQTMTAEDAADVKTVNEHVVNFRISFYTLSSVCTE